MQMLSKGIERVSIYYVRMYERQIDDFYWISLPNLKNLNLFADFFALDFVWNWITDSMLQ